MTETDLKKLVRNYLEMVWNNNNHEAMEKLTTPGFKYHLGQQEPRDRVRMKEFLDATHKSFPDWKVKIVDILQDSGRVVIRWEGDMTHEGSFHGIPPTGRKIHLSGINVYRIEKGLIAEEWEQMDSLAMLQQLGVLPAV